ATFRRILDDFGRNLTTVETTLAAVKDDDVKLPLRFVDIHVDLDGDGKPTDEFMDILDRIVGSRPVALLETNPEFLVCFDRGDVAWLRSYCHVLAGLVDLYLAFDTQKQFDLWSATVFARPKSAFAGDAAERLQKSNDAWDELVIAEPKRLSSFRRHIISLAELNRETWKHIRAETDDENEWLPNPKQTGVLRMPVRDEMIDTWLAMMDELEALFDGKKTFIKTFLLDKNHQGLDFKVLFDDPPERFVFKEKFPQNLPDKYWSDMPDVNIQAIFAVIQVFGQPTAVGYAAWFN
ncbi:MAG TPA: hypothetical protein VHV77_15745, partial [Pirellulales bacterium]|nr:hypothetical protein [Pirellulales bacterium]